MTALLAWTSSASARNELARRYFSAREVAELEIMPVGMQTAAFYAAWTRKEAFIKATGLGLTLPLDQFSVSLTPGQPAALQHTAWDPAEAGRWSLLSLALKADYAAALAVAGEIGKVCYWDAIWLDCHAEGSEAFPSYGRQESSLGSQRHDV